MAPRHVAFALLALALSGCTNSSNEPAAESNPPAGPAASGNPPAPLAGAELDKPTKADPAPVDELKTAEKPTVDDADSLVAKAQDELRNGDLDQGIDDLKKALAKNPEHRQAMGMLPLALQERAMRLNRAGDTEHMEDAFLESAKAARKLMKVDKNFDPRKTRGFAVIIYNEACVYGRRKEKDKAVATLAEAIDFGFRDGNQIDIDTDLDSIRDMPKFKELREKVKSSEPAPAEEKEKSEKPKAEGKPDTSA